ncbi:hypothetical protein [Streptosporangium sp. NPDC051022]|uniref:hypothetical protein n=1 Tax=Streptosporangium sp. NPDC051022 TaxID=3155752 RepID=UPI003412CF74
MIAFIMMIEVVLVLMGLMVLCRLTRYQGGRLSHDDRHVRVSGSRYGFVGSAPGFSPGAKPAGSQSGAGAADSPSRRIGVPVIR